MNILIFLESSNTLFNCDIISLCETSPNNGVSVPNNLLNPSGDKKGGMGIFYKG